MSYKSSKLAKRKKKKDELALRPIKDNVLLVEERLSHVPVLLDVQRLASHSVRAACAAAGHERPSMSVDAKGAAKKKTLPLHWEDKATSD